MLQIAAQVAVAVDNTLNFERAEKYQRQLARERDRLQVLLEITNALVSELDIHDLFPSITACLRRAVPHEFASLALRLTGTDQLRVHALVFEGDLAFKKAPRPASMKRRRAKLWKHGERWFWTPRDCETFQRTPFSDWWMPG
jgi:hypothetical protein